MKNQRLIRALLDELPELLENGVLDSETALRMDAYYRSRLETPASFGRYLLFLFSILGVLLIGGGVILVFAHNWDWFPKYLRVGLSFLPLLMGACLGGYTIIRDKSAVWRECSAVFTGVGICILIALISQIYHMGGSLADFLRLVLILCIPAAYLFRSAVLLFAYCVGIMFLTDYTADFSFLDLAYLLAPLPFCIRSYWKEPESGKTIFLRYALFPLAIGSLLLTRGEAFFFALLTALFLLAGIRESERHSSRWYANPWLQGGFLSMTIMLCLMVTSNRFWSSCRTDRIFSPPGIAFTFLLAAFVIGLFLVRWRKNFFEKLLAVLFPLFVLGGLLLHCPEKMLTCASVFFALSGLIYVISGYFSRQIGMMNAGMLQLILLIFFRFASESGGILSRAIQFLVCGALFLLVNFFLGLHFRGKAVKHE